MRVTFIPEFNTRTELRHVLFRAAFYLAHTHAHLTFQIDVEPPRIEELSQGDVPEGYDPVVLQRALAIADRTTFTTRIRSTRRHALGSDAVLVWNWQRANGSEWNGLLEDVKSRGVAIYGVDRFRDRLEGSQYIQASFDQEETTCVVSQSKDRFEEIAADCSTSIAYLLGTGPSINKWRSHAMTDGIVIACNTTILNSDLMEATDPSFVVFADPIFHFGCSTYGASFREALSALAERQTFTIAVPLKYRSLLLSLCPQLHDRVVAIPMVRRRPNLNLLEQFEVKTTANVATLLMLPLASTLAEDIRLLGFDGRHPDDSYFWQHSPTAQLTDELDDIRGIHPAFFTEVDHASYYNEHVNELESVLTEGEIRGRSYRSLEPTRITPLRKRSVSLSPERLGNALSPNASFRVISLNPDYEDDFGHYGTYDSKLRETVLSKGGDFLTLASTGYEGTAEPWVIPSFTDPSWSLNRPLWRHHKARFADELEAVVRKLNQTGDTTPTVLIMYMATPRHVATAAALTAKMQPAPPMALNLFHAHQEMWELETGVRDEALTGLALLASGPSRSNRNIVVYADSEELAALIQKHFAEIVPLWPMFSFTPLSRPSPANRGPSEPVIVYAPGNMQHAKGYDLVARLAERLAVRSEEPPIELRARVVWRQGVDRSLTKWANVLRIHAKVSDGILSNEEYARHLNDADVLLVPYRQSSFATRTSAVIADALILGKPVVTTEGTWMGRTVTEFGTGETFRDGDLDDMERALNRVVTDLDRYKSQARTRSARWPKDSDLEEFVEDLRKLADAAPSSMTPELSDAAISLEKLFDLASEPLAPRGQAALDDETVRDLRAALSDTRSQLRAIKSSTGYRSLELLVRLLKTLGPAYNWLHDAADAVFRSGPTSHKGPTT